MDVVSRPYIYEFLVYSKVFVYYNTVKASLNRNIPEYQNQLVFHKRLYRNDLFFFNLHFLYFCCVYCAD